MSDSKQGWFQCIQCGHGHVVHKWQFEAGDHRDKESCPHCGTGTMLVDWKIFLEKKNENR